MLPTVMLLLPLNGKAIIQNATQDTSQNQSPAMTTHASDGD